MANSMLMNLRLPSVLSMGVATLMALISAFTVAAIAATRHFRKRSIRDLPTVICLSSRSERRRNCVKQALRAGAARANIFDHDFIEQIARIIGCEKSRLIAVICAPGNRSTRAVQMLAAAGFSNVQNVREGNAG